MMDEKLAQQVFEELLPSLEALDTKCAAILQFLKSKKIASDDELAPYFAQAENASSVRWRAARVRINHLLSTRTAEKDAGTQSTKASEKITDPAPKPSPEAVRGQGEKEVQGAQKAGDEEDIAANKEKDQNKQEQHEKKDEHIEKDAA
jgi:hypothetical protein